MSQPVVVVSSSHMSKVKATAFMPSGSFTRRMTPSSGLKGVSSCSGDNLLGGVVTFGIARRWSRLVVVQMSFADEADDNVRNSSVNASIFFMMIQSPLSYESGNYYSPAMKLIARIKI